MPLTNFPNGISSFGVPIMGSGATLPATTGSYFFVHSGTGAAGNTGKDSSNALSTIDAAIGMCTASKGDVIVVMPGHAESFAAAAGFVADVAGISIIGLGNGENRPVITFTTSTAADIDIDAANVRISNIVFKNDIDAQLIVIDVNSTGFTIENCEFVEGSAKQWATGIDLNGGTANACDRAAIIGCRFKSTATGADNAIKLAEVADRVVIRDCVIDGDFNDAGIHNPTGKTLTNLVIRDNVVRNRQTGDHAIELVSACTGECVGNALFGDTLGTILDPGSLFCAKNEESAAIDVPGVPTPVAIQDSSATPIGANSSNNTFSSSSVTSDRDGSVLERLEDVEDRMARTVVKAAATMVNGQVLFTVAGGPILIQSLVSLCATSNDATASTLQYSSTPTTGAGAQTISAASGSLANAAAGASVTLAGTALSTAALLNANGPNLIANPGTVFIPIGTITSVIGVGSTTGTWAHYLRYVPLTTGVTVS